jgi:hypothetical protein
MKDEIVITIRPNSNKENHVSVECKELGIFVTDNSLVKALETLHTEISDQLGGYEEIAPTFLSDHGLRNKEKLEGMRLAILAD